MNAVDIVLEWAKINRTSENYRRLQVILAGACTEDWRSPYPDDAAATIPFATRHVFDTFASLHGEDHPLMPYIRYQLNAAASR